MRVPLKPQPSQVLERVLDALGRELIEATDEELVEAAASLGMNPLMNGSAAFAGLKYAAMPRLADFFNVAGPLPAARERPEAAVPASVNTNGRKSQAMPRRKRRNAAEK